MLTPFTIIFFSRYYKQTRVSWSSPVMKTKVTYATDLLVTIDLPPRQLAQENRPNQTIDFKGQATSLPLLPKMARAG